MYASAALSSTNRCIHENRQHHHTTSSFSGNYVPTAALRKQRDDGTISSLFSGNYVPSTALSATAKEPHNNIITLSMGMLPMLKWVFENHCYWKTERRRNLEKKNQLQQEEKKIQESFHSFFFDENMSKIKFAKQENSLSSTESLAPHTELTYPFFHCLHNIDIVRNVHKADVASPHKNQWHMLLTSLSIHHRNKKHSCL
jgi:hypothetical protein